MEHSELGSHSHENWTRMQVSDDPSSSSKDESNYVKLAVNASWAVNWLLLIAKVVAFAISSSKAVLAALADSAVDLVSQAVLSLAETFIAKHNPDYPVGRSRLEALSVLACACIMTVTSIEVIQFSAQDLDDGLHGRLPDLNVDAIVYALLSMGVIMKLLLWMYCTWVNKVAQSDMLTALSEDHLNDVMANIGSLVTVTIAVEVNRLWWFDPFGAILISIVIIGRWISIILEQVRKIVGYTAPPEFREQLEALALAHDPRLSVDCIRAYYSGARYNVEMEIVLPGNMTVWESHDLALILQHKIEELSEVERAFVHVDHQGRDGLEHKIERHLVTGVLSPLVSNDPQDSNKLQLFNPRHLATSSTTAGTGVSLSPRPDSPNLISLSPRTPPTTGMGGIVTNSSIDRIDIGSTINYHTYTQDTHIQFLSENHNHHVPITKQVPSRDIHIQNVPTYTHTHSNSNSNPPESYVIDVSHHSHNSSTLTSRLHSLSYTQQDLENDDTKSLLLDDGDKLFGDNFSNSDGQSAKFSHISQSSSDKHV